VPKGKTFDSAWDLAAKSVCKDRRLVKTGKTEEPVDSKKPKSKKN
jgi:hypothetical protein